MFKLNKHLLLFLAVLFMLILIPTAFAGNIDDASAAGVDNQLAVDDVSLSTNDVAVESVSQSAADNEIASDGSDALKANNAIYVDSFDGTGGSGTSDNP